jgi:hypothetical protein
VCAYIRSTCRGPTPFRRDNFRRRPPAAFAGRNQGTAPGTTLVALFATLESALQHELPSDAVFVAALIGVFLLLWVGVTLLLDAWSNRRASDLVERLRPNQRTSVADKAQRWLESQ